MPSKKTVLNDATSQAMKALELLTSEEADALIGSPQPEEYGKLVKGVQGIYQMLIMMAVNNGMRQSRTTLDMGGQGLITLLTLIHYAYALGVRRGMEINEHID